MKELRLEIQSGYNREKVIGALADEGYWVRIVKEDRDVGPDKYYVLVEVPNHAVMAPAKEPIQGKAS